MRSGLLIVALLAAGSLVASPALAKHKGHTAVPCKEIKDAIASGKTEDEVAKDLKTTTSHVKSCTAPPKKHTEKKS